MNFLFAWLLSQTNKQILQIVQWALAINDLWIQMVDSSTEKQGPKVVV